MMSSKTGRSVIEVRIILSKFLWINRTFEMASGVFKSGNCLDGEDVLFSSSSTNCVLNLGNENFSNSRSDKPQVSVFSNKHCDNAGSISEFVSCNQLKLE